MMLRASSQFQGEEVDLQTVVGGKNIDSGVPGNSQLTGLVEAALEKPEYLPAAREAVVDELGPEALVDAAGVIGNFQRMVRIADSTGIPLDPAMATMTEDIRGDLGLDNFSSARPG